VWLPFPVLKEEELKCVVFPNYNVDCVLGPMGQKILIQSIHSPKTGNIEVVSFDKIVLYYFDPDYFLVPVFLKVIVD